MLNPAKTQKLQDAIYKKMSAQKKIKLTGQMFLLGQKLRQIGKQNVSRTTLNKNRSNFRRP